MDPAPLSVRELVWMAEGRQRAEWARVEVAVCRLAAYWGDPPHPATVNPFWEAPPDRERGTPEEERRRAERAMDKVWAAMG